jgi:hypothetical protein
MAESVQTWTSAKGLMKRCSRVVVLLKGRWIVASRSSVSKRLQVSVGVVGPVKAGSALLAFLC